MNITRSQNSHDTVPLSRYKLSICTYEIQNTKYVLQRASITLHCHYTTSVIMHSLCNAIILFLLQASRYAIGKMQKLKISNYLYKIMTDGSEYLCGISSLLLFFIKVGSSLPDLTGGSDICQGPKKICVCLSSSLAVLSRTADSCLFHSGMEEITFIEY